MGSGYAAFAVGLLYALVSLYWAAGGTAGLNTVGGELEGWARERAPGMVAVLWVTAALKLVGALLGLSLVQRWGHRLPRWLPLTLSWVAAVVLAVYGGALVAGQLLVQAGAVRASPNMDWTAFHGHLYLWDPWFLLWGLLLGYAAWGRARHGPR